MKTANKQSSRLTAHQFSKKVCTPVSNGGGSRSTAGGPTTVLANSTNTYLHPARVFNSSPISPRKCRILLTKIAYLLYTGERFPTSEATELFFGITKLFQHRDASLRQMVYVVVKELADTAEDVIMITSSVMKDVAGAGGRGSGEQDIYRANAIRALCRIIDVSLGLRSLIGGWGIGRARTDAKLVKGHHRTSYRASSEDRNRRQNSFRLLCRTRLVISSPPHRSRHCPPMGKRDTGSCARGKIVGFLAGLWFIAPCPARLRHDPVPRHWTPLPDACP